ncbi:DUF2341 domain-containing protein [Myxococcota bacterium]
MRQSETLLLCSAVVLAAVVLLPGIASAAWYDAAWTYRKQVTLDRTKVTGGPHGEFPVLISISDADLSSKARADGSDIFFTEDDGSTLLDFEIEAYEAATGTLVAWVKAPSLTSFSGFSMYLYYGNASPPASSNPANVWNSGYIGVWHLKETPTIDAFAYDSTSYDIDHAFDSAMTPDDQVGGRIGGSLDFDGSTSDRLIAADRPSLGNMSELTVQTWIRVKQYPPAIRSFLSFKGHSGSPWFTWQFLLSEWGAPFYLEVNTVDSNYGSVDSTLIPNTIDWYHVVGVYEHDQPLKLYVNGVDDTAWTGGSPTGNLIDSDSEHLIGNESQVILDELRISGVARNAGWIQTEYNNQSSPGVGGFVKAVGPEQVSAIALFRSVGVNGSNLNTANRTVEVDGNVATFSGPMPDNVGVGDVLQFQVVAAYHVAFITGRTSSTVYSVQSAIGATPQAAAAGTTVGVFRAYTSIYDWEVQNENDALDNTVEDFDTSTDLVTDDTIMLAACYDDGIDSGWATIDGWITGQSNYLRIFTPNGSHEVGLSQRHDGTAGTGFRLPSRQLREDRGTGYFVSLGFNHHQGDHRQQ